MSPLITSLQRSTHSTQMPPCSPRISFGTCSLDLPQSTQRRISSRSMVALAKVASLPVVRGQGSGAGKVTGAPTGRTPDPCLLSLAVGVFLVQLFAGHDFVDEAVGDRLLAGHPVVAIRIPIDLFNRLAGVARQDLGHFPLAAQHLPGVDLD